MLLTSFSSIMMNILYVVIAIVVLLTMVLIHELGHYIAGRALGFTITEFSIGFGKVLWQKTNKRGEKISLRLFPLGGFCAFLGENDDDEQNGKDKDDVKNQDNVIDITSDSKQSNLEENTQPEQKTKGTLFNDQKPWKRIIVYIAGVTFNFLSAFIFAIIFLCVGAYDGYKFSPSEGYTINMYNTNSGEVIDTLKNDTIVYAINGVAINYARGKVFASIVPEDSESIILTIDYNGEKLDVKILRNQVDSKGNSIYGINYSNLRIDYDFGDVLRDFIPFTFELSVLILKAFWQIITGKIAIKELGGPISTISQMTLVASYGIANFLYLLPLLAANLAIFNILPIPGLDGAHVVFTTIEWIRGKPIKRNIENAIHAWGIICLFAFVIIIDIYHILAT